MLSYLPFLWWRKDVEPDQDQADECFGCHYWRRMPSDEEAGYPVGLCCRHAPQPFVPSEQQSDEHELDQYSVFWPRTINEDWCGEFKPKEEKP